MRVLIAEDDLTSRIMLQAFLKKCGYDVVAASDGQEAWEMFQTPDPPKAAVVDWMMPGVSGPELCRKLRAQERTAPLYIILLTSKDERQDIIAGLESGADDYIAKPYDNDELRVRLEVGVRLVESEEKLIQYAENMESLAEERARQLVHADRLATLGTLSAGIAHEINNPVAFISGNAQTQRSMWKVIEPCLQHCHQNSIGDAGKLAFILKEMPAIFEGIIDGVTRVSAIVKGMKGYSRQNDEKFISCDINHCVEEALLITRNSFKYNVNVEKELTPSLPSVWARPQQITQVFVNLLTNAADAMEKKQQGAIRLVSRVIGDQMQLFVEDDGPGINKDILDRVFDPFFTTKPMDKGTGLGLSISKGIVEDHGGSLSAENRPEKGTRFTIKLPLNTNQDRPNLKEYKEAAPMLRRITN